jgi:hypothetical protein
MDPLPSMTRLHGYCVYGMAVASDVELGSLEPCDVAASQSATSQSVVTLGMESADFFRGITEGLTFDPEDWFQQAVLADGALYMRCEGLLECVVSADGRRVAWGRLGDAEPVSFEAHLLNFALSAALLQQGEEPLHATVVDLEGRTIGLLGESGAGKSTLAAFLIAQGGELVTDDMLRLTFTTGTVLAHRGPNRLKLFDEPARHFLPGAVSQGHFNPLSGKLMFRLSGTPREAAAPRPLSALFHLGEAPDISLTQVRGAELVKAILSSTMNTRLHTPARLARQFAFAERLARLLPVYEAGYPRAYPALEQVAAKIRGVTRS